MTNHFNEFGARLRQARQSDKESHQDLEATSEAISADALGNCCQTDCQDIELHSDCCSGIQRDRFELLSAYLDGEVTAAERRQVEDWLATDSKTQHLYRRLLTLRQGLQTLPIIQSSQVDQLMERVTARVERQPRRLAWGGLAAAGLLIGALFSALPPDRPLPLVAQRSTSQEVPSDGLMIALNHPPIAIPKTALPAPPAAQKSNLVR